MKVLGINVLFHDPAAALVIDGRTVAATDRRRVLLALEDVDEVVVLDEDTPMEVICRLRPDAWAKGSDYNASGLPEDRVLEEVGGQGVTLPYLEGRSTPRLVRTAAHELAAAVATEGKLP